MTELDVKLTETPLPATQEERLKEAQQDAQRLRELTATILTLNDSLNTSLLEWVSLRKKIWEHKQWETLGYDSWQAYCKKEMGGVKLKIDKKAREDIVVQLTKWGMSQRDTAVVIDVSNYTVSNVLANLPEEKKAELPEKVGPPGKGQQPRQKKEGSKTPGPKTQKPKAIEPPAAPGPDEPPLPDMPPVPVPDSTDIPADESGGLEGQPIHIQNIGRTLKDIRSYLNAARDLWGGIADQDNRQDLKTVLANTPPYFMAEVRTHIEWLSDILLIAEDVDANVDADTNVIEKGMKYHPESVPPVQYSDQQ